MRLHCCVKEILLTDENRESIMATVDRLTLILMSIFLTSGSSSIEDIILCNSTVFGEITPSSQSKYYAFTNNDLYSNILIDLSSYSNHTNFDTILNLYDQEFNLLNSNDNAYGEQQISFQPQPNIDQYIIEIKGGNMEYGTYQMDITCTDISSVAPSRYYTSSNPSPSPSQSPTPSPVLIFYDRMRKDSAWTLSSPNHIQQVDSPITCTDPDNECIQVKGYKNEECYIQRSEVNSYKHYKLQFDLTISNMTYSDYCRIQYSFDNDSWTELHSYHGQNNPRQILNQSFIIDVNPNETIREFFYIRLEAVGDSRQGYDYCYYDNVYLWGSQFDIYLPSTYPYLDAIESYIECGETTTGRLSNNMIAHYYAFNNSMDDIFIRIGSCDCADIYINLWDQYGRSIQTISWSSSSPKPLSILSTQVYILEIYAVQDSAKDYQFELKCHAITRYIQCGDRISDRTSPEDDYHWYLFQNSYEGNRVSIDTCKSLYYINADIFDDHMDSVVDHTAAKTDSSSRCLNTAFPYGTTMTSESLAIGIYMIMIYGYGGRYIQNYGVSMDCSIFPIPTINNTSIPSGLTQYIH